MVSDDVMNSVEIVAYCESYFFLNMECPLNRKKCLQCHAKSMFTKHQEAETKKYLSFVTYIYEISSEEEQQRLKALVNLGINGIESINYLPPVQHYCHLHGIRWYTNING